LKGWGSTPTRSGDDPYSLRYLMHRTSTPISPPSILLVSSRNCYSEMNWRSGCRYAYSLIRGNSI
jgi:hypothetical protein